MGKVMDWFFPGRVVQRTQSAYIAYLESGRESAAEALRQSLDSERRLSDQLAAKTFECESLKTKLSQATQLPPIEPVKHKARTAAEMRQIWDRAIDTQEVGDGVQ